jgi:hypothetical protein
MYGTNRLFTHAVMDAHKLHCAGFQQISSIPYKLVIGQENTRVCSSTRHHVSVQASPHVHSLWLEWLSHYHHAEIARGSNVPGTPVLPHNWPSYDCLSKTNALIVPMNASGGPDLSYTAFRKPCAIPHTHRCIVKCLQALKQQDNTVTECGQEIE